MWLVAHDASFYEPSENWFNCIKTAYKLQISFKTKIIAASTLPASIRGGPMIRAIEIRAPWIRPTSRAAHLALRVAGYQPVQRVVPRIEASYALIRQRALSIITVCSIVLLASIWLAAAIAQAQEPASKGASLTATEPALVHLSIEKRHALNLLLSMVDRSDREPEALRNSAVQSTNPLPIDAQSAGEARLPPNPQGAEFASLVALASAPPSSLYYSIQAKTSGKAGTSSHTNDNRAFVYQLGTVNLVIKHLPNSFSVPSAGNSLSDAR